MHTRIEIDERTGRINPIDMRIAKFNRRSPLQLSKAFGLTQLFRVPATRGTRGVADTCRN
jgi:hypothetical protein